MIAYLFERPEYSPPKTHISLRLGVLTLVGIFIYCYAQFPVLARPWNMHDDGLFFRAFTNVVNGEWLGNYDSLSLVKGPLLSILAASSQFIGIPWVLMEGLLYTGMMLLLARVSSELNAPNIITLALVFCLATNPHLWSDRYFSREVLYGLLSLTLLVLIVITISLDSKIKGAILGFFSGLTAGALFLTREEDVWMVAVILTVVILSCMRRLFWVESKLAFNEYRCAFTKATAVVIGFILAVSPVLLLNQSHYGRAVVSEFRAPEFKAAVGALMRVGSIHPSGNVPVPQATMQAVFESVSVASPLKEYWPAISIGWSQYGDRSLLLNHDDHEILGGWFVWALREAVAAAGFHYSAHSALDYYGSLAKEINAACDAGKLSCRYPRATLAPEITPERYGKLVSSFWRSLLHTVLLKTGSIIEPISKSDSETLLHWEQTIGPIMEGTQSSQTISGWIASRHSVPSITVVNDPKIKVIHLQTYPGIDVIDHYKKNEELIYATRFKLTFECPRSNCTIQVSSEAGNHIDVPLENLLPGPFVQSPFYYGLLDDAKPNANQLVRFLRAIVSTGVATTKVVIPLLCLIGSFGLLMYPFLRKGDNISDYLFIFSLGAATAVFARCGIVAYIDATSWSSVVTQYLGPAYGFVISYAIAGTALMMRSGKSGSRS